MVKLGMIGGGVMGEALISRLIMKSIYQPIEVLVSEPNCDRRNFLQAQYGVQVTPENTQVTQASDVILLAIKPQIFPQVATELQGALQTSTAVLVSILAGTSIAQLEAAFPNQPILRAMPNTPAQVGAGITAIARGQQAQAYHVERAQQVLATVGSVIEVPEALMDAVTGLSGSGPGYVALVIEALADGGVVAGLPRSIALQLAIQTVLGTAQLLQESGLHPGELKDRVTSPGGTTIAGIAQLEKQGLRSALIEAVRAASNRSKELGDR